MTRTQPRTERLRSSSKWRPMLRSEESDTALPQKDRFSFRSCWHPSARTSVAVSERAQQKDFNQGQHVNGTNAQEFLPSQDLVAPLLHSLDTQWRYPLDMYNQPNIALLIVKIGTDPNAESLDL